METTEIFYFILAIALIVALIIALSVIFYNRLRNPYRNKKYDFVIVSIWVLILLFSIPVFETFYSESEIIFPRTIVREAVRHADDIVGHADDVPLSRSRPMPPLFSPSPPSLTQQPEQVNAKTPHVVAPDSELASLPIPVPPKTDEELVQEAFEKLPIGEFFHTVPDKMQAGTPILIEAGIAKEVTQQLLDKLQVQGEVKIREDIRYDPLGVEIKLDLDKEAFKTREITAGVKPIVSSSPELWLWEITPLKRGDYQIVIFAVIELKVPEIDKEYKKETIVFKEQRKIEVNYEYAFTRFTANNWKEVSTLVFGSGSVAWLLKWWLIDRIRRDKSDSNDAQQGGVGFARFLRDQESSKK